MESVFVLQHCTSIFGKVCLPLQSYTMSYAKKCTNNEVKGVHALYCAHVNSGQIYSSVQSGQCPDYSVQRLSLLFYPHSVLTILSTQCPYYFVHKVSLLICPHSVLTILSSLQ